MAELIWIDGIASALGLGGHEMVALVGGGGKTTIMAALGHQLAGSRILTTTTKMGNDQDRGFPVTVLSDYAGTAGGDDAVVAAATAEGAIMAWATSEGSKAVGVEAAACDRWFDRVDHVVIEADGARKMPFKAPASYEPVVPARSTALVSIIGSDALDQPINETCHRPHLVSARAACCVSDPLSPEHAAAVLLHPKGALRSKPGGAHFAVVITKVTPDREAPARRLAEILEARTDATVILMRNVAT